MKQLSYGLLIINTLILLLLSGCESRDQENKTLKKQSADRVTVPSAKVDTVTRFSFLTDSVAINSSGDSTSMHIPDLIAIIGSQTRYLFVWQPARVENIVTTVRTGRIPLKDLLQQIEITTNSTISILDRNLVIAPND